jgi:uncharacterized protein (UPF0276 family)
MTSRRSLLRRAGIGLRSPHHAEFMARRPAVALVEVHSENFFGGGRHRDVLRRVRRDTPVSLHGIGLSLGSTDALDLRHLRALAALVDDVQPMLVSDHLSWSSVAGVHANDLLPLPYTPEALAHVCRRVEQVQALLGRRILVENVSSYLQFEASSMAEWEFLAELAARTGCGVLLDVNNVHVSACNHGFDPLRYLEALPTDAVQEMHLAGHVANPVPLGDGRTGEILIDTHSRPVAPAVWRLYRHALARFGPVPTIVEWDADLPPLDTLIDEAAAAERCMEACDSETGHACAA